MRCSLSASSRQAVELERITFTGAPAYSEDGDLVVPHEDPVKYTGTPSPDIDQAWGRLVEGELATSKKYW